MIHGSEYVAMPSRANAALSSIGLCKVVLRVKNKAGTVIRSFSPNRYIFIMRTKRRTIKDQINNDFANRISPPFSFANYCYMKTEYTTHKKYIYSQKQTNKNPFFESNF